MTSVINHKKWRACVQMYNSIGVALIRRLSEYMQLVIKAGSCVCVYVHGMMHVCFVTHAHTHIVTFEITWMYNLLAAQLQVGHHFMNIS